MLYMEKNSYVKKMINYGDLIDENNTRYVPNIYEVGDIFLTMNTIDPGKRFGGTWALIAQGRTLIGLNLNDSDFSTIGKTGGSKTHNHTNPSTGSTVLTVNQMPSHNHNLTNGGRLMYWDAGLTAQGNLTYDGNNPVQTTWSSNTQYVGGGQGHTHSMESTGTSSNIQPYITCYIWKRIS
jgi:hypothetical protein